MSSLSNPRPEASFRLNKRAFISCGEALDYLDQRKRTQRPVEAQCATPPTAGDTLPEDPTKRYPSRHRPAQSKLGIRSKQAFGPDIVIKKVGGRQPLRGKRSAYQHGQHGDKKGKKSQVIRDRTTHPYVQLAKKKELNCCGDEIARKHPSDVSADTAANLDAFKEPFIVPAAWNPSSSKAGFKIKTSASLSARSTSEVMPVTKDLLDMTVPQDLTAHKVAKLFGPNKSIKVIDVEKQETEACKMQEWADRFGNDDKKHVRNLISLEVSASRLGPFIKPPKFVRDLDLQAAVWPSEKARPHMTKYCLMSDAGSYTDFHIDLGGTSVYYHILNGSKTFFLIRPTDANLTRYKVWCNSSSQKTTFFGDLTEDCMRVDLQCGDTAYIPAGWIHAVWTPETSMAIGGNFLTRTHYEMQFKVRKIEIATCVPLAFQHPNFDEVFWLASSHYMEHDPVPLEVIHDVNERGYEVDWDPRFGHHKPKGREDVPRCYPASELEGLPFIRDYLHEQVLGVSSAEVSGTRKKSKAAFMPPWFAKNPSGRANSFAVWCAVKMNKKDTLLQRQGKLEAVKIRRQN